MKRVIKKSSDTGQDVERFSLSDMVLDPPPECDSEIAHSPQEEADAIITEAKRHAESVEREAYQKGFEQGEKAGLTLGEQKLDNLIKSMEQLLDGLAHGAENLAHEHQQFIVDLAVHLAVKILHQEISINKEAVLHLAGESLAKAAKSSKIVVKVSPADFQFLQDHRQDLLEKAHCEGTLVLEPDPEIIRGGCFVLMDSGDIDATIDNQLQTLRRQLNALSED